MCDQLDLFSAPELERGNVPYGPAWEPHAKYHPETDRCMFVCSIDGSGFMKRCGFRVLPNGGCINAQGEAVASCPRIGKAGPRELDIDRARNGRGITWAEDDADLRGIRS